MRGCQVYAQINNKCTKLLKQLFKHLIILRSNLKVQIEYMEIIIQLIDIIKMRIKIKFSKKRIVV